MDYNMDWVEIRLFNGFIPEILIWQILIGFTMLKIQLWLVRFIGLIEMNIWSEKIVILFLFLDLGFFHRMNGRETKSLINQELPAVIRHNRECPQPMKLHFTNYHPKIDKFKPIFKEMLDNSALNPETLTSKSYLDLFPRNRLVYLSPDSREVLWNYNPDDVYIIGGLVDLDYKSKESLAIAKQQEIRHARLPMGETLG